jgi:large subunit ribosomal protein L20
MSYSQLIGNLKKADVQLNRKMLAQLAVMHPEGFTSVMELANQSAKG